MRLLPRLTLLLGGLYGGLCLCAFARPALGGEAPCKELAAAVDLSGSPSDDRRQFCKFAKDMIAGGCCQSSLYDCLKSKPACARGQVLGQIGLGVISTGATEEKAVAAATAYEDGIPLEKRNVMDEAKAACKGPKDGMVFAEFSDFDCPHCAAALPVIEKLYAAENGPKVQGKGLRWCSFTFPLPGHPYSQLASAASLYAESQGKYWPMAEALFATQGEREAVDEESYRHQLLKVGASVGLDPKALAEALKATSPFMEKVKDQQMLGIGLLLQGTPSFFLDGHSLNGIPTLQLAAAVHDERESQGKR